MLKQTLDAVGPAGLSEFSMRWSINNTPDPEFLATHLRITAARSGERFKFINAEREWRLQGGDCGSPWSAPRPMRDLGSSMPEYVVTTGLD